MLRVGLDIEANRVLACIHGNRNLRAVGHAVEAVAYLAANRAAARDELLSSAVINQ